MEQGARRENVQGLFHRTRAHGGSVAPNTGCSPRCVLDCVGRRRRAGRARVSRWRLIATSTATEAACGLSALSCPASWCGVEPGP
jgi:hypothetical protein